MMSHGPSVHRRRRRRVPDRRPADLGAALARHRAARVERAGARRSDQARDAPVDRRGRHARSAPTSPSCATRSSASAASWPSAAERVGLAVAAAGTHPFSHWKDQVISPGVRYDSIVEELQQLARSLLIFGLHVHVAVPDRHDDDRPDERGALLPAAPAGAVDQLAVLDGARHRAEVVPHDRSSGASRAPACPITSARGASTRTTSSCSSICTASTTRRRSGGTCGRIRRSARSSSASATCRRGPKRR